MTCEHLASTLITYFHHCWGFNQDFSDLAVAQELPVVAYNFRLTALCEGTQIFWRHRSAYCSNLAHAIESKDSLNIKQNRLVEKNIRVVNESGTTITGIIFGNLAFSSGIIPA